MRRYKTQEAVQTVCANGTRSPAGLPSGSGMPVSPPAKWPAGWAPQRASKALGMDSPSLATWPTSGPCSLHPEGDGRRCGWASKHTLSPSPPKEGVRSAGVRAGPGGGGGTAVPRQRVARRRRRGRGRGGPPHMAEEVTLERGARRSVGSPSNEACSCGGAPRPIPHNKSPRLPHPGGGWRGRLNTNLHRGGWQ